MNGRKAIPVVLLALAALLNATPARAATISVTTTADESGTGPACSLREAIRSANTDTAVGGCPAGSGADAITIPAGTYPLTVGPAGDDAATTGDLDVTADTSLLGAGANATIVDGQALDRVFHIDPASSGLVKVSMSDLTVRNGRASLAANIWNDGILMLSRAVLEDGVALSACCGALYTGMTGNSTVLQTTMRGNRTESAGGAATLSDGVLTIRDSLITDNSAEGSGGGVLDQGTLTLTNTTISGNDAAADGGGIYLFGAGTRILNNLTIVDNTSDSDSDASGDGGGVFVDGDPAPFTNSIIANNRDASPLATYHDCSGVIDGSYDLIENSEGCSISGPGHVTGKDPMLGALGGNGGPTQTHPLLAASPAIDAGSPAAPGSGGTASETTDPRGVPRNCDIGAYERVLCRNVLVNRVGTEGRDILNGTPGADGFLAGGGNDRVVAAAGKDAVCLGGGNDRASGGGGRDVLLGEAGKDKLRGQGGKDLLVCGKGRKEHANGGPGKDRARGCERGRA